MAGPSDGIGSADTVAPSTSAIGLADGEPVANGTAEANKNRPKNVFKAQKSPSFTSDTRLRQQRLPAWQPILTASSVIPAVVAIGLIFLPAGVLLTITSNSVKEKSLEYTSWSSEDRKVYQGTCAEYLDDEKVANRTPVCRVKTQFELDKFEGDVYFYYGLENYYQNHRRYMKSRSDVQLLGQQLDDVSDCSPFNLVDEIGHDAENGTKTTKQKFIVPCGAVANSMFNDTFVLRYSKNTTSIQQWYTVPFSAENIVWSVDRERKYRNPKNFDDFLDSRYAKPVNWRKPIYELGSEETGKGFENVDFIVWMRTAALPNFRKLYRKLKRNSKHEDEQELFKDGLPAGSYQLDIEYNYPVTSFNGKKRFIISTTTWVGGRNNFLGIAYLLVGVVCLILGGVFVGIHIKFGKSLTEISTVRAGNS